MIKFYPKHHRNFSKNTKEKFFKSILTKADTLVDHTTKIDGQLCDIIDSLQYNTKKENNNKKDLESFAIRQITIMIKHNDWE